MKNKFSVLSSVALILIGAAACTDEVIIQESQKVGSPIELTFRASNDKVDDNVATTRTLVREGFKTYWTANDRISLFDGSVNNPFITKDGGIVADFKGTVTQSSDWYFALYP